MWKLQSPPSSPISKPLDFSLWNQLASAVTAWSVPKNMEELIPQLEDMCMDILEPSYVKNCCRAAWERLRRVVDV